MRTTIRYFLIALVMLAAVTAFAQFPIPSEAGLNYNYVHSNAPPAGCGCFTMQGASGWAAFDFVHNFALVGEIGMERGANILGSSKDLMLVSYTAGPRYTWHRQSRFTPFGQALIGGAHASGSYAPAENGLAGSNSFVMIIGGGVNVALTKRFTLQALQADYYLTHFSNGTNNHQNNLRLGIGFSVSMGANRR